MRAVPGAQIRVQPPLRMVTLKCCSGPGVRAVPGVQIRVQFPLRMVTWKCCSGPEVRAVPGVQIRVQFPLRMVTWKEVLQWARSEGCPWGTDTCAAAAKNGCCSGPKRYTKKRVFKTLS